MGELIILNWVVVGSGGLANGRQRVAGSGGGVLARLCCRVVPGVALPHPGWLGCPNVAWLQRNQQISGRGPPQCVAPRNVWPIGEAWLGCDGHTGRYGHWGCRGAPKGAPNELWAGPAPLVVGCRVWRLQAPLAANLYGRVACHQPMGRAG